VRRGAFLTGLWGSVSDRCPVTPVSVLRDRRHLHAAGCVGPAASLIWPVGDVPAIVGVRSRVRGFRRRAGQVAGGSGSGQSLVLLVLRSKRRLARSMLMSLLTVVPVVLAWMPGVACVVRIVPVSCLRREWRRCFWPWGSARFSVACLFHHSLVAMPAAPGPWRRSASVPVPSCVVCVFGPGV